MTPDVVVDIGNTRMKWGLCRDRTVGKFVALAGDDPTAWQHQLNSWNISSPLRWAIASVHPTRLAHFADWLTEAGHFVTFIHDFSKLPMAVDVEQPERVGIDRLLSALAARTRMPDRPLVIASVGTAITVDYVSREGRFLGGAIFPGLATMARSLRTDTAALPEITITNPLPPLPGKNTEAAIRGGIYWAAVGGIAMMAMRAQAHFGAEWLKLYLTGGDAWLFEGHFNFDPEIVDTLTVEGVRLAAEALP